MAGREAPPCHRRRTPSPLQHIAGRLPFASLYRYLTVPVAPRPLLPDAGFVVRPLGALLFGTIGDIYGRNLTLRIAIVCMAVSRNSGSIARRT